MSNISANTSEVKSDPPALQPYDELSWRALRSAILSAPSRYAPSGWFWLDREGRRKLEDDGLDRDELRSAINYGVAEGLLARKVVDGIPCVGLTRKGARR